MSAVGRAERDELVRLLREVSPGALAIEPPRLREDLAGRAASLLPRRPRAILFDVYGTLVASAAGGEPALGGAGAREGEAARELLERELVASGFGAGAEAFDGEIGNLIERTRRADFARTPNPEVDIERLVASVATGASGATSRRLAALLEAWRNPCAPMPGAVALLGRLRENGLRLGIVSNAQFYTPLVIEALLGRDPESLGLEPSLTAYSFEELVAKPDPAPFKRAAGALLDAGIGAGEILVIGNSAANDVAPARALGFMTALFAGDSRSFRPGPPGDPGLVPDAVLPGFDAFEGILPP